MMLNGKFGVHLTSSKRSLSLCDLYEEIYLLIQLVSIEWHIHLYIVPCCCNRFDRTYIKLSWCNNSSKRCRIVIIFFKLYYSRPFSTIEPVDISRRKLLSAINFLNFCWWIKLEYFFVVIRLNIFALLSPGCLTFGIKLIDSFNCVRCQCTLQFAKF